METETNSARHQRKWKNYFVNPAGQLRLIFAIPAGAMISVVVVLAVAKSFLEGYVTTLPNYIPAELVRDMQQTVTFAFSLSLAFVVFATLMVILVGILLSHRFYGPVVAILRAVRAMTEGNYDQEIRLRPQDELQDLARALNELQAKLRQNK